MNEHISPTLRLRPPISHHLVSTPLSFRRYVLLGVLVCVFAYDLDNLFAHIAVGIHTPLSHHNIYRSVPAGSYRRDHDHAVLFLIY